MPTNTPSATPPRLSERIQRRVHQVLMLLLACALLGCASMVGGPAINDWRIGNNPGRSLARVVDVSDTRAIVDFQDHEGRYHSPPGGLLYPTGLGEGQRVWVNYAKDDPNIVKVEGRKWTLSIIPALSVTAIVLIIFGLAWITTNFAFNRYRRRQDIIHEFNRSHRTNPVTITRRIPPRTNN